MLNLIDNAIKFSPEGIVKVELACLNNEKVLIKSSIMALELIEKD